MSEIEDKLSNILNNPDSMQEIMKMAAALSGGTPSLPEAETDKLGVDPQMLSRIMGIINEINSSEESDTSLLYAIRPYLSPKRQSRFNDALKIMRIGRIIPHLKDGLI